MAEYIKREAALQIIDYAKQLVNEQIVRDSGAYELLSDTGKACYDSVITTLAMCKRLINEAVIAADVQPIRHGRWSECYTDTHHYSGICSVCGKASIKSLTESLYAFCPKCGARMDLKDGDTD